MTTPAWESDPTTRHEYRWWNGEEWTDHVADDGIQSLDPLTGAENLGPPKARPAPAARAQAESANQAMFAFGQPVQLAPRAARFGGRLIDMVVLVGIAVCLLFLLHLADIKPLPTDETDSLEAFEDYFEGLDAVLWIFFAATAVYEVGLTATRGQTLGKMATRVLVVRAADLFQEEFGRPPSWGRSFVRWAFPAILGLPTLIVPFIGNLLWLLCYLSLTWDRERQGWHDKAADTFVVGKP